jgi:hypothetical protein
VFGAPSDLALKNECRTRSLTCRKGRQVAALDSWTADGSLTRCDEVGCNKIEIKSSCIIRNLNGSTMDETHADTGTFRYRYVLN